MSDPNSETHLDPTAEINLETVKKRAVSGVVLLVFRTTFSRIVALVSQFFLLYFLLPEDFGVFLLVSATINFLSYFADIGLGAALIQKKEKPEKSDFGTVFVTQEILVISIVLIVFIISPVLARTHSLNSESLRLLYALNLSFFLASLKNIPSIILERKLEFGKLIIPSLIEETLYSIFIVYFAWKGLGVSAFTYSVLIRGVVGVIAIYFVQPWKPSLSFSKESFRGLLKYGIPYQLNSFLATIKDDGMTIMLGKILGAHGLGIFGNVQKLSQYPLRFFMDPVNRVTFPAFSRMQHDNKELARTLSRSIFFITALTFPSLVIMSVLFPVLINAIPRYLKWQEGYMPLIILSGASMWSAITTQFTNVLASIGKIKIDLKLMVMWTSLTWLFVPLFSGLWGINGTALAFFIVSSSSIVVFVIVKKFINWKVKDSFLYPLIASLSMGAILVLIRNNFEYSLRNLILLILIGGFLYLSFLLLLVGKSLIVDVKKVLAEFKNK